MEDQKLEREAALYQPFGRCVIRRCVCVCVLGVDGGGKECLRRVCFCHCRKRVLAKYFYH